MAKKKAASVYPDTLYVYDTDEYLDAQPNINDLNLNLDFTSSPKVAVYKLVELKTVKVTLE